MLKFVPTDNPANRWVRKGLDVFEFVNAVKITSFGDLMLLKPIYAFHLKNIKTGEEFLVQQSELDSADWRYGIVEEA